MSAEKLPLLLDVEEPKPSHDAGAAAMGRTAVSAAIELLQARLAEPTHRDLTVLHRIGWLLAAIGVVFALGAALHLADPPRLRILSGRWRRLLDGLFADPPGRPGGRR
jgi:hypothetical protein